LKAWVGFCVVLLVAAAVVGVAAQAAGPAAPDELILAVGGDTVGGGTPEGYDPTLGWGRYGSPLFQSTLLKRDADLNIVNDLAKSVTVSPDRLVWTVKIRPDAKFSDGQPVTARDVAFTFNQAAQSGGLTDVTVMDKAVAVDDTVVELHLKRPQSTFVNRLISLGIVSEHAYGPDYARHPIGSGPYKLVQWDPGQQLIVEANPYYYGEKPQFKRLVFLFLGEDTAFAAARAGKVHVVAVPQALAVQKIDGMTLQTVPSVDNRGLSFPFVPDTGQKTDNGYPIGNNVTADPAIRHAINVAVDRQALVDGILEGFGSPAFGPVSGLPWDEPGGNIKDGDVETARQILAEAGWADKNNDGIVEKGDLKAAFTIYYAAGDATRQSLALALVDMLKEIGIQADVQGKSWDDIARLMHSNVVLFGWGSHDQSEMYDLYHSAWRGVDWYNANYYANPAVDKYLDQAMASASETEAIPFWKKAQWDGQTGFSPKADAPWAWLVNLKHTYFVDKCLDIGRPQVEPHLHGWPITANITSWKWTCK